ncbi:integrator complex subunit 2-domain-containing protein [Entophlyctis helioformis]|nr:integrator complex subunit 2-domain-containing protein [Entophlyctis helioformis]
MLVQVMDGDFGEILHALVKLNRLDPSAREAAIETLRKMVRDSGDAQRMCLALQQEQAYLELALQLVCSYNLDMVSFLNTIADESAGWIKSDAAFCQSSIGQARAMLAAVINAAAVQGSMSANAALVFRAYASLAVLWGVQFDAVELYRYLAMSSLIQGHHATQIFTSFIVLVADQVFATCQEEAKVALRNVLQSDFSEYPHVLGVYFLTDQPKEIQKLLFSTLRMPCQIRHECYQVLRKFFSQEVYTNKRLAETALALASKPSDILEEAEDLSISLMFHLLKAGIFKESGIDIQPAMYAIIRNSKRQHDQLPGLLRLYAKSSFEPSGPFSKLPIEPSHILHVLESSIGDYSEAALLCFCVLFHRRQFFERTGAAASTYDDEFVDSLCLRPVIDFAEQHIGDSKLYPQLCPEYFEPSVFLDTFEYATPFDRVNRFENLIKILKVLYGRPCRVTIQALAVILSLIQKMLDAPEETAGSQPLSYWLKQVWLRLLQYHPRLVFSQTVAVLSDVAIARHPLGVLQPRETQNHVEAVLKLGQLFAQHPTLFPVFLHLIRLSSLSLSTKIGRSTAFTELQRKSALLAQDAMIVQSLLQLCDVPGDASNKENQDSNSDTVGPTHAKIRSMTCQFIHQIFVNTDVKSLQLVHFQGYNTRLIPMAVELIPSLHVCIGMVPEMLARNKLSCEQFVFTVTLAAHLFAKYPLQHSLDIAVDHVKPMLFKWAQSAVSDIEKSQMALAQSNIMPSIVTICYAFKSRMNDFVEILGILQATMVPGSNMDHDPAFQQLEIAVMQALADIASKVAHGTVGINKSLQ